YAQKPLDLLAARGCDLLLNLSCSPFTQGKNQKRNRVFSQKARKLRLPLFYVNCVSLQNNGKTLYTFDGRSTAYAPDGAVVAEMPAYARQTLAIQVERRGGKTTLAASGSQAGAAPSKPALPDGKPLPE